MKYTMVYFISSKKVVGKQPEKKNIQIRLLGSW